MALAEWRAEAVSFAEVCVRKIVSYMYSFSLCASPDTVEIQGLCVREELSWVSAAGKN
jgi:hypothetical protein